MIHKHFKTRDNFDQEFFKFPSTISDNDICFIKDTGEIWTHGKFYAQTDSILESLGVTIKYTEQSLTEAQKTQARENIGAGSSDFVIGTTTGTAADGGVVSGHIGNTSNPHEVTKEQIGLSDVTNDAQVKRSEMGEANGVATLSESGKVPTEQLYDTLEGYGITDAYTKDEIDLQEEVVARALNRFENQSEIIASALVDLSKTFEGLGKESLKENIIGGTNTLTQEMLSSTNTIYSIAYDYMCNSNITIPTNCTLEFNGGSITGGNITLQNTKLEGDVKFSGTTISGSCANDVLTPQMFGAYPELNENENNKTQHTLAFQNLVRVIDNPNTLTGVVYLPSGHYSINAEIFIKGDCKLYGNGDSSVIDIYDGDGSLVFGENSNACTNSVEMLDCTITADAVKADTKIVVDDTSELSEGDYIILTDAKDGSFHASRVYYRTAEALKIKTISGNNVYFESTLYGDYFVDYGENETTTFSPTPQHRTIISKFTPKYYNLSGFKILSHPHNNANPSKYYSFVVKGSYNSVFNDIIVENYGNTVAGSIALSLNFNMEHCTFRSYTTYVGDAYGLYIAACQSFVVKNSTFRANSHALCTSSFGGFSIINRNFLYENLYLETSEKFNSNLEEEYDHIDLDVHASAEYYKFLNISAPYTTCDSGGYNVTIEGCRFYNISPTFNGGDFSIKKCEIFGAQPEFLMSNISRQNYNGHNSLVFEDCIIHGVMRIILQDENFVYKPYNYFIFKNNIFHNTLEVRKGSIDYFSLENNVFTHGNFLIPANQQIRANNVSIKNNNFQNGSVFLGFHNSKIAEGTITNNTIIEKEDSESLGDIDNNLSVYSFKGNISNNVIISYKDNTLRPDGSDANNVELIRVGQYSDVQIYDNYLRKTTHDTRQGVVFCSTKARVIFDRNIHNSIRYSPICVTPYDGGNSLALSNYYQYIDTLGIGDSLSKNIAGTRDNLGKTFFVDNINKMFYIGSKKRGNRITYLAFNYQGNGQTAIIANTLTFGKSYIVDINNSGQDHYYLYFSKYNVNDERFNKDELLSAVGEMYTSSSSNRRYVFTAPDPTEYPYLYGETNCESGVHIMNIYENNWMCEMDGCAYNVKRRGTTSERPSVFDIVDGFRYFDTDLNKEIFAIENNIDYNVTYWRESDGAIAGVKRIGTTSERPGGLYKPKPSNSSFDRPNIYIGFRYYDTDLGQELYASAIAVDGTVTWTEMTSAPSTPEITEQIILCN